MLTISYATPEDAPYVLSMGHWPPSPLGEHEVEMKIRDERCYILRENGQIIGILRWNMMFEFVPFLTLMWFDKPHRGKGYGKQAITHWEDEMRRLGYKMIMVSTQVDEDGQHFYRKMGYKDMGSIVMDIAPYEQPLEMFLGKAL
ncbi:MAG: GNAT family N-acetyltransferase [Defluviitaleaceae bacterium]|nr:GNAT family N-acetyltransferase [Defluviitaleaceae bacterium]